MLRLSIYVLIALSLCACGDTGQEIQFSQSSSTQQLAISDYMPADGVLGQLDFTTRTSPILDAQSLDSPIAVAHIGDHLLVADFGNLRVLGYAANAEGTPSDTASMVLLQPNFNTRNYGGMSSDLRISPTGLATDAMSRLYVQGHDNAGRSRILVFDNPFTEDTLHEYELLDLPENIGAMGSVTPELFVVIGGPGTASETVHFYAMGHLDAPPLRQADVPSPCNGHGGARGFVRLQDYLAVACAGDVYAAPLDPTTGFLEPSAANPLTADWTHVLTGFANISAIDGIGGIVDGELREEAFVVENSNDRIVPLPNPVFYIETRRDEALQPVPYDVSTHPDFQRFLGHADLSAGPIDPPELADGPNYHPDPELSGSPSEWGLWTPSGIAWNNDSLWVADFNNNRVVRFGTDIADLSNTEAEIFTANLVMGQPDFTHNYNNRLDGRDIVAPTDIALVSNGQSAHLISSDRSAHRVMVHTLADRAENGVSADAETLRGQTSLYDYSFNQGTNDENGAGYRNPLCVDVDPVSNRVIVCDSGNSRVVVYDAYNSGPTPVAIIGRREGDEFLALPLIKDAAIHGNFVFVAMGDTFVEPNAHQILIYDLRNLSTEDGVPDALYLPTDALGQDFDGLNMPSNICNQNDTTGPDTLCNVQHLATDEMGNLWVSDTGNNRVLMFEDPTAHLQASATVSRLESTIADHVLGQPDMLSNEQYFGADDEKTFRLIEPDNLALSGGMQPALWLIDKGNRRVLYFPTPHLKSEESGMPEAAHVLGSTMNGSSSGPNTANQKNVNSPVAVAVSPDNNLVFVADDGFRRILRFTFNDAPSIALQNTDGQTLSPHIQVEAGEQISILVTTSDPEGDAVSLEVEGLSAFLSFDSASSTLLFDATGLNPGHITYATIAATDGSPRANRTLLGVGFEIIADESPAPTTSTSAPERAPESIPDGGCQSVPISLWTLVIPFLLIYRRRLTRI